MINPVIAITLYRRPEFTRRLFECLSKCYGIEEIPIVISCDWSSRYSVECDEVYHIADEFWLSRGCMDYVQSNKPRLGIDLAKLSIIPKAFERGNYVIFLEDDTPISRDALQYFIAMGERYEFEKDVLSVTAYNRVTDEAEMSRRLAEEPYVAERVRGFRCWSWAMWQDRWSEFYANNGEQYKSDSGKEANGLFDRWLAEKNLFYIQPRLPRANHATWEAAEHTPSFDFWHENEASLWASDMPSADGAIWTEVYHS